MLVELTLRGGLKSWLVGGAGKFFTIHLLIWSGINKEYPAVY